MKRDLYLPYFKAAHEIDGIISLPLYDSSSCQRIVEWSTDTNRWSSAEVHAAGGQNASVVRKQYRSAQSLIPPADSQFQQEFDETLEQIIRPLIKRAWQVDFASHHDTHLVRYPAGGFYVPHVDAIPGPHYRYFTFLCYLNDDFEGGATTFPTLNLSVKPETGKAILFPASFLHCAEPVTRGEKYVLVSWFTNSPPIAWI